MYQISDGDIRENENKSKRKNPVSAYYYCCLIILFMQNFISDIRDKYGYEPPVIYYLLENSIAKYHEIDEYFYESKIYQTDIKIHNQFYKPISNIDI
jgi:hypothetical protein